MKPVNINMRKWEVFQRRRKLREEGVSSMGESYRMVREEDPNFEKTIARQEDPYLQK